MDLQHGAILAVAVLVQPVAADLWHGRDGAGTTDERREARPAAQALLRSRPALADVRAARLADPGIARLARLEPAGGIAAVEVDQVAVVAPLARLDLAVAADRCPADRRGRGAEGRGRCPAPYGGR